MNSSQQMGHEMLASKSFFKIATWHWEFCGYWPILLSCRHSSSSSNGVQQRQSLDSPKDFLIGKARLGWLSIVSIGLLDCFFWRRLTSTNSSCLELKVFVMHKILRLTVFLLGLQNFPVVVNSTLFNDNLLFWLIHFYRRNNKLITITRNLDNKDENTELESQLENLSF